MAKSLARIQARNSPVLGAADAIRIVTGGGRDSRALRARAATLGECNGIEPLPRRRRLHPGWR